MLDMEHLDEFEAFVRERFSKLDSVQLNSLNWYPAWYYDNCEVDGAFDDVSDLVGATIYFGCTKVVFLFSEYPQYVVKVPFVGVQYWETEDDCDEPSYVESEALFRNQEDYCAIEEGVYSAARFDEVEDIFAETSFLGQLGEVKMYVAECAGVSFFGFSDSDISDNSWNKSTEIREKKGLGKWDGYSTVFEYLPIIVEQYGAEYAEKLVAFCEDEGVQDLHHGNVAWNDEGKLKFIDYSGYNEVI